MKYDKPFKTFDELAHFLETEHGLPIMHGDAERKYIASALQAIPYYDLINGYKDFFMENDHFRSNVCFPALLLFYSFDRGFQNVIFPFSIMAEDYFKNILSYIMARDFGVSIEDYLNRKNYVTAFKNITYFQTYEHIRSIYEMKEKDENGTIIHPVKYIQKNSKNIEEPTRHYIDNHNHVPPWILLKNVTFSNAINLFLLMKQQQWTEVADLMISAPIPADQKRQILIYALTLIRHFRNHMAHNLKFISFQEQKKFYHGLNRKMLSEWLPKELISESELKHGIGIFDIYAYLLFSMALIPDNPYKLLCVNRLLSYLGTYSNSPESILWTTQYMQYTQATNIPHDFISRLTQYRNSINHHLINQFPASEC